MPDTGAPWNIPYVADSDLVRDFPTADEAQALAIAAGLTSTNSIIRQVVQTVKTDTFSASLGIGAESGDVTGLTATITPQRNTNKVLVQFTVNLAASASSRGVYATLFRDGSVIAGATGDALSARPRRSVGGSFGTTTEMQEVSFTFLDSPASTLAILYSIRLSHGRHDGTLTVYVNRTESDADDPRGTRTASTITASEVFA
jgi:hypothetical protein